MELLENLYLTNLMHVIASDLLIPVVIVLLVLIVYALYSIGSVLVEVFAERRYYRAQIPQLVAALEAASPDQLTDVIEASKLLRRQKDDLVELAAYLYLPQEARTEVAKRLLANQDQYYQKILGRTDAAAKVAPMLGLMGTLIPLGPGIVALGSGDTEVLSQAMLVAFDTTIAGLATAVVCYLVSRVRRRWYSDYLVSMEALFNALLEKALIAHEAGYQFPRTGFTYKKGGRKATATVSDAAARAKVPNADGGEGGEGPDAAGTTAVEAEDGQPGEGAAKERIQPYASAEGVL